MSTENNLEVPEFRRVTANRELLYPAVEVDKFVDNSLSVVENLNRELHATEVELESMHGISEQKEASLVSLRQENQNLKKKQGNLSLPKPVLKEEPKDSVAPAVTLLSEAKKVADQHIKEAQEQAEAIIAAADEMKAEALSGYAGEIETLEEQIRVLSQKRDAVRKELSEVLELL